MADTSVLVIEDEPEIRKFLKTVLANHHFRPSFAETAREGVKLVNSHPPETIILDLGLPDMDGLEVIRRVREWSDVPIIVLSARGQEQDKVTALESGADDYLTKPFGAAELLARLKVSQRHRRRTTGHASVFKNGDIHIDFERRTVLVRGVQVDLTPTEYKMLVILAQHVGKVVTHGQFLNEVWGRNAKENNHYLRIYVRLLRKKLGDDPLMPKYIATEAGIGYRLKVAAD